MCVSPADMTEQQLKDEIQWLKDNSARRRYYLTRALNMEAVLQERFPQPKALDIGEEKRVIEVVPIENPSQVPAGVPGSPSPAGPGPEPAPAEAPANPDRELVPA
jgi:hypothetical protein